jgi:hypothetical protein
MQAPLPQAADRLRDIVGIGGFPWWPPAPGWWLLIGAIALIGFAVYRWHAILRLRVPIPGVTLGTWRWDAAAALRALRRRARSGQDPKTTAGELSELLRRIAMARLGRDACAGLTGQAWLDWLSAQDPNRFPWQERGRPLLEIPYAPPRRKDGRDTPDPLPGLIDAAYAWVSAPDGRRGRWALLKWRRTNGALGRRGAMPQGARGAVATDRRRGVGRV